MILSEAMGSAMDLTLQVLTSAGLVDGLQLGPEDITAETNPMCWPIQVEDKEASSKERYATYAIGSLDPYTWTDNDAATYKASMIIEVFSRKRYDPIIDAIDAAFIAGGWRFSFVAMGYDNRSRIYSYTFRAEAVIGD